MKTKYPIYVISKGRWKKRQTQRCLELMGLDYKIVIESSEYKEYSKYIDDKKIIVLPFENLGQGSIPARNYVLDHSVKLGYKKHWILDDNIDSFYRLNRNMKVICMSYKIFNAAEDFTDRYSNVAISGFNYNSFVFKNDTIPPYTLNTRIYSCILLNNEIGYRWRGKYNEDTDLSLRVLKDGYCTILFNAFLANKETTLRAKGGNTDTIYNTGDNRREFAESLKRQHPECVEVVWRYNRWHHKVNYQPFKNNRLIKIDNSKYDKINNYGMILKEYQEKKHITKLLHERSI
jgi:hypothetical protein